MVFGAMIFAPLQISTYLSRLNNACIINNLTKSARSPYLYSAVVLELVVAEDIYNRDHSTRRKGSHNSRIHIRNCHIEDTHTPLRLERTEQFSWYCCHYSQQNCASDSSWQVIGNEIISHTCQCNECPIISSCSRIQRTFDLLITLWQKLHSNVPKLASPKSICICVCGPLWLYFTLFRISSNY